MLTKFGLKVGLLLWLIAGVALYVFGAPTLGGAHDPHAINPWEIAMKAFNIVLLIDIIVFAAGGNIRQSFIDRRKKIISELEDSKTSSEEARIKLDEVRKKLEALDDEIESILQTARKEAEEEKSRILENATIEAKRLLDLTKKEIKVEITQAAARLKAEIADLALVQSEEIIKGSIQMQDHGRFVEDYVKYLERIK